jgi:hypothetical protein
MQTLVVVVSTRERDGRPGPFCLREEETVVHVMSQEIGPPRNGTPLEATLPITWPVKATCGQ